MPFCLNTEIYIFTLYGGQASAFVLQKPKRLLIWFYVIVHFSNGFLWRGLISVHCDVLKWPY